MKKFFIPAIFIAALTNVNSAIAQKGLSVSIKAIPQFSFFQNEDYNNNINYNNKATITAAVGAGVDYGFNNHAGIGADALLSFQGQRYTHNNVEYNQKVNYVKVPVYITYYSDASKPISLIGKMGPQVSFISDANFADKDGNKIISNTKNRYKNTTFGVLAAAGAQYKLVEQTFLSTSLRFDYDFTTAQNNTHPDYTYGTLNTYNSTVGLEVGLKYIIE